MSMPAQTFWRAQAFAAPRPLSEAECWQIGLFLLTALLSVLGGTAAFKTLQPGGLDPFEVCNLVIFQVLFAWIAYALASALVGFGVSLGEDPRQPAGPIPVSRPLGRTAVLMPVHNEDPDGVFARLRNMEESLRSLGASSQFHFFVLSDTRDPDIRRDEHAAFLRLRALIRADGRLFYRLRAENSGRKAGNIAEWVRRFGGAYDYMVVLDADSVMDGTSLIALAGMMDRQPKTGLIQTVPRLVNRRSLFGRVQQFASRLYGPMLSDGLAHTCGAAGNYWGHNAIIRVAAFAAHAGLPRLHGPRPWSGDILSHDFVEAALLRRAGWEIRLAPELGGSFEECPPTLPDLIVRERRWCQGNLQHLPLIAARGLHWMSRVHLAQGVLTYLMPPLWLLFLLVGAARSAEATYFRAAAFDDYTVDLVKWLLAISLLSLFMPRLLALLRALLQPQERRAWGSPWALVVSVFAEAALSALIAPILMTAQTKALFDIMLGRDSGWPVQQRADGSLSWREAARRHWPQTVFGFVFAAVAFAAAPGAALWTAPVIAGLIFAIPIAVFTSDPRLGADAEEARLFVTPEERDPPAILAGLAGPSPVRGARAWTRALDALFAGTATRSVDA